MTWHAKTIIESTRLHRFQLFDGADALTIGSALQLLKDSVQFRSFLVETLAASPFAAFRWEWPAITRHSIQSPCEFVLHDARLPANADPVPFAEQFRVAAATQLAVAFSNLGKDAVLVVPTPHDSNEIYTHLAVFLRRADEAQRHALLALVGETALAHLAEKPFWLSTAGMGVAWLHVRIDSSPKYFGYDRYKRF